MSDDEHIKSEIQDYLSGALVESRRRQIEAHAAACTPCRHAITKARSKFARARRQALKNAVPEPRPNLLFNRLGKQGVWARPPQQHLWRWVGLVLVVGGVALMISRKESHLLRMNAPPVPAPEAETDEAPVAVSSPAVKTPAAGTAIAPLAKASPPPVPIAPVAVATGSVKAAVVVSSLPTLPAGRQADQAGPPAVVQPPAPFVPQMWSGAESGVKDVREVTVRGRTPWRALWQEMAQPEPAPRVNFYQAFVVGIFIGEKPSAGFQVTLGLPREENDSVVIPYKITEPPADMAAAAVITHPYALVTIPRTSKPIHFEQSP